MYKGLVLVPISPKVSILYRETNGINQAGRHTKPWLSHTSNDFHVKTDVEIQDVHPLEHLCFFYYGMCEGQIIYLKVCVTTLDYKL